MFFVDGFCCCRPRSVKIIMIGRLIQVSNVPTLCQYDRLAIFSSAFNSLGVE